MRVFSTALLSLSLLTTAVDVNAEPILSSFDVNGVPIVSFTASHGVEGTAYAGAFDVQASGLNFKAFCVDLATDVGAGPTTFNATIYSTIHDVGNVGGAPSFTDSAYSDVGNRLAYMGTLFSAIPSSDLTQIGAFQLGLWSLIDRNFVVTNAFGNQTLTADLSTLMAEVGAPGQNGTGYDQSATYLSGELIWTNPQAPPRPYQNLVTYVEPGLVPLVLAPVPEPSSLAMTGTAGALCGLASWWRRKRSAA